MTRSHIERPWRLRVIPAAIAGALAIGLALTGCASGSAATETAPEQSEGENMPEETTSGLLEEAEAHEAQVNSRLDEAQQLIAGGDEHVSGWEQEAELELMPCTDTEYSYVTRLSLGNTDGWRFPVDVIEFREAIGQRFVDAGWQDISGQSFEAESGAYSMTASYPDEIRKLLLMFHPGEQADGLTMYLESACWPGAVGDVWKLQKEKYSGS